jgi:dedicator of cytokinesis protein 3
MQHIDCLFSGRRQLLAQTHTEEELARVRRECVSRLVKCNVAQGLDVIVRSLHDGSVMVTDREKAFAGTSCISGITAYVYQIQVSIITILRTITDKQLAYIDLIPLDTLFGSSSSLVPPIKSIAAAQPSRPFSLAGSKTETSQHGRSGSFHHLSLDVKAFIANPCASEETAELYFSLYNSTEVRFVTEEYCVILNHQGTPARDAENRLGKLRTLFTDLQAADLSTSVYIVCRIVRNGAMKMKADTLSPVDELGRRTSTVRGSRGNLLSDFGTRASSVFDSNATDDSFSITSAFGVNAVQSVDTANTASTCIVEGRPSFRRPFGCAVLELPQLQKLLKESEARDVGVEFSMPIYVPKEEGSFARMHEDIILGRTKNYHKSNK